jgi:hypothetical protein
MPEAQIDIKSLIKKQSQHFPVPIAASTALRNLPAGLVVFEIGGCVPISC